MGKRSNARKQFSAGDASRRIAERLGSAIDRRHTWTLLEHELSQAAVEFWWRDDDAAKRTPTLDDFLVRAEARRLPVALAVIPGKLDPDLVPMISRSDLWAVVQHGYLHLDRSARGQKCELSDDYSRDLLGQELLQGRRALLEAFGEKALAVVAPPWNRIGREVRQALPELGFRGLSVFGPRDSEFCEPGLVEINTHVDLIDWLGGRVFCGETEALTQIISHLQAKRLGLADPAEATGILSHHERLCAKAWSFIDRLLATIANSDNATWVKPTALFGPYLQ